ncbi:GNAT family N-acetyltransferase [Novosphingobium ginsenosidimutans]|uniref:GNAT family N-acetyltransferase n=1 Tax=Novosphingobium ginsenosidimutans TaxID=1176536 RepID=UPI001EE3A1BC|nr:GNAT family N-acetyltransferase [Novosphingobium ginsenosidimutans]
MSQVPQCSDFDERVIQTRLEDGRAICIRAVRPDDEERLRDGVAQLSNRSRYLRFFTPAPTMPDHVIEKLADVDGHRHLAWGALLSDVPDHQAIGVVHAVRSEENGPRAEFAIAVLDDFHGQGLARMLSAVLLIHCWLEGIATLDSQVLLENRPAIRLLRSLGAEQCRSADSVGEYALNIAAALEILRRADQPAGLKQIFAAFDDLL